MNKFHCPIITKEIKELAKKLPKETEESVKGLVALWQARSNKSIEEYPSLVELTKFTKYVRSKVTKVESIKGKVTIDTLKNNPNKFFLFEDHSVSKALANMPNYVGIYVKNLFNEDFEDFKNHIDTIIKKIVDTGGSLVIPEKGLGKNLEKQAPLLYKYLQEKINAFNNLYSSSVITEDSFSTPAITLAEEHDNVYATFDTKTRTNRINLISRYFSAIIDNEYNKSLEILNKRIEQASLDNHINLLKELEDAKYNLDRNSVAIEAVNNDIFNTILNIFKSYVEDSVDNNYNAEYETLKEDLEGLSEDRIKSIIDKRVDHKRIEYQKIIDNFRPLVEESLFTIYNTEGILIRSNTVLEENNIDQYENNSQEDGVNNSTDKENAPKERWMLNVKKTSSLNSLSQKVRDVLRDIPKLDSQGYIETDDLGNIVYIPFEHAHITIMQQLQNMTEESDMIPMLQELSHKYQWVDQIIDILNSDDTLFSLFYTDFRKDANTYSIQRRVMNNDGTFKMKTVTVNRSEGITYLLDEWRDNYELGNQLDIDHSVYNKDSTINIENAEQGKEWVNNITTKLDKYKREGISTEEALTFDDDRLYKSINKLLRMVGINSSLEELKTILVRPESPNPSIILAHPVNTLLLNLNVIYSGIVKNADKIKSSEESLKEALTEADYADAQSSGTDLINTFNTAYINIGLMFKVTNENVIESAFRENGASYYTHTVPNYLGKLIKELKNVRNNDEKYRAFLLEEFKKYEWFYKDGKWLNSWLEELEKSKESRDALKHKVLLHSNGIEMQDMDSLDYTLSLLTEYWGDPNAGSSDKEWAYYHVPILSDTPSSEFIRFRKYSSNKFDASTGERISYVDTIVDKMVDTVKQEYNRIMLVRNRNAEVNNGNTDITLIENFDTRGLTFVFFPDLNTYTYPNGDLFIDRLNKMFSGEINEDGIPSSGEEIYNTISEALKEIMNKNFEEAYKKWYEIGLFRELENGKYKYIPFSGQSKINTSVVKTLTQIETILGKSFTPKMKQFMYKLVNNEYYSAEEYQEVRNSINTLLQQKVIEGILTTEDYTKLIKGITINNSAKEALKEYFWNSSFATSQIIQLTATDLAYYKSMDDFQKRYKHVHAPGLRLNTSAKFNGAPIGRKNENALYIEDAAGLISETYKELESLLQERVNSGQLAEIEKTFILSNFRDINQTDGQSFRSLDSYRSIKGMIGRWDDKQEEAYNRLKDGTWNLNDFNIVWSVIKPFVYTQVNVDSGIEGINLKSPVMHKNSEYLLLAMYDLVAGPLKSSGKLRAISKFMQEHDIDVVHFTSVVKVGKPKGKGVINLEGLESEEDVYNKLYNSVFQNGSFDNRVVHTIPYSDYGIQTETPDHYVDAAQLIGTQIRKLITADMPDNMIIDINGISYSKEQWMDLYNKINTENILQSFMEVNESLKDIKEVEKLLQSEIKGNPRYGIEIARALTLNENGEFNIPLFDPTISIQVQNLINSFIKNKITKQKIKGGSLIQVSNYGLTQDLKVVYEGEGNEKRVKYLEAYLPAYSKAFIEEYLEEGSHVIDANNLPEELRKVIGYRVPTEDKYSMLPIYIKGFLPSTSGAAIMLPAEITKIMGSDFDVDKLYMFFPEFKINKEYDIAKAWKAFYAANPEITTRIDNVIEGEFIKYVLKEIGLDASKMSKNKGYYKALQNFEDAITSSGIKKYELVKDGLSTFKKWFNQNKNQFLLNSTIEKIEYNHNLTPKENGLKARNNLLIDMMWGVLTNKDTALKMLTPGGYEKHKKSALMMELIEIFDKEELLQMFKATEKNIYNKILSYDVKDLIAITEKYKKQNNPLSPITQVIYHQQNMTGANLIGIYANHNAHHALMQHTKLTLNMYGKFTLNDVEYLELNKIKNTKNEYISRNNAGFLSSSVDNGKDPILSFLNQNQFTADIAMFLSRAGVSPSEIAVLLNQPIIKDITNTYLRESREGISAHSIVEQIIQNYESKAEKIGTINFNIERAKKYKIEDLFLNLLNAKKAATINSKKDTDDADVINFYKNQVNVGYLFRKLLKGSKALGELVQATRFDAQNGGAGPTIAETISKINKLKSFYDNAANSETFPLSNYKILSTKLHDTDDEDTIRELLLKSQLPFLQAFFTLGVLRTSKMLENYFPHYKEGLLDIVAQITDMNKYKNLDVKTLNSIYNDYFVYIMTRSSFFGEETKVSLDENGKTVVVKETAYDKRFKFINHFADYFEKIVAENPDIAKLDFISRLKVLKPYKNNPVKSVAFRNVGHLTPILKDKYTREWEALLYSTNPKAQELALNLFRYNFFKGGFAFGPSSFIHLTPLSLRKSIPNYSKDLKAVFKDQGILNDTHFISMYVENHLDNRKLVPELRGLDYLFSNTQDSENIKIPFNSKEFKNFVKRGDPYEANAALEYYDYFGVKIKGNMVYYKFRSVTTNETDYELNYTKVTPKGIKNNALEYEYGVHVDSVQSVIQRDFNRPELSEENVNKEYMSQDLESVEEPPISNIVTDPNYLKSLESEYIQNFGVPDNSNNTNNMEGFDTIPPNLGFTDADNNFIKCPK